MNDKETHSSLKPAALAYQKKMSNPFYFWFGMLIKLPSAVFWKFRIKELDAEKCVVTIPYTWRTQNPFNSIYFAAMAGAAELSTGALCQLAISGLGKYAMLVVDFRAEYYKKANQKIKFTCEQGLELFALLASLEPNDTGKLTMISTGKNPQQEEVARFYVTWSFKRKS
ncbi:DUF4442 domain-containing protein [Algoriphagus yeomjeoni]|uniref:Uncharacterized protein DUF4442 n=1 Tax=Algoriphagus yeomjeoni TaxID=291403 RepID=A0A327PQI6_9BACT|nr:DUF4442 domain-containing protein [Algoriphagus yeomjeoni]RAI93993.1 uncharacterized protein DUF4442 [Algoriphagus yeomjeoni]